MSRRTIKVALGLSGGVDSSVAAALLLAQGYEVTGVYLECYNEPGCRTDLDKKDALKVALQLGIPFKVLDFRKEYREKVVEYFYETYEQGLTPNPDVVCNREIKFGIFYQWAMEQGYDYVATGHYARIKDGKVQRGRDTGKDQSYFLWQVPSDHLEHVMFPLGELTKAQVRAKAKELKLPTASKPDSMGICFIGEVDVRELLNKRLGEKPGEVSYRGEVVGRHKGLWFYTVGQRGGWELLPDKQTTEMKPLYVVGKDREKNILVVGERQEAFIETVTLAGIKEIPQAEKRYLRIRNLGELYEIEEIEKTNESVKVKTKEKVFGAAEGQYGVIYAGEKGEEVVVSGGVIV